MSADHTTQRKESPPKTRPWEVEILPDMFGYHLHVDGRRFFIPAERIKEVQRLINYWAEEPTPMLVKEEKTVSGE